MEGFGARVRAMRERMGMSQRDLGAASGLSQATLCRIERDERAATSAETVMLANGMGATVAELTGVSYVRAEATSAARAVGADVQAMYDELVYYLEVSDLLDRQGFGRIA